jgi:hypothetical protein
MNVATQSVEVLDVGSRPQAAAGDPAVVAAIVAAKWLPGTERPARGKLVAPLFSPLVGEVRRHIGELIAATTPVFFLRDNKRDNSVMQTARDPARGAWDPARAADLRAVDDADKPLEIVWEYEWFHAVPAPDVAERLMAELRRGAGKRVARTRLLRTAGEFGALVVDEVSKPEGPLSTDHYYDTEPMPWGEYDALMTAGAAEAWTARKRQAVAQGWVVPHDDTIAGGYNILHGSTVRKRHFGDLSQRWHTGAMNIEPFYRRPAPGLGERLEYNFYLHPDAANALDLDLAIATGAAHPELGATNGFRLAREQMPGLALNQLRARVQISKTRRKFLLKDPDTGEIHIILNVDRIEAADLQSRVKGSAVYYDVDVSAEGDVLKEPVLQRLQRFVRMLQRTWGLEPNDQTRHDRAEAQLRRRAEQQGLPTTRFHTSIRRSPAPDRADPGAPALAQELLAGRRRRPADRLDRTLARAEQEIMRGEVPPVPAMRWARAGQRRHQTLISIADPGIRFGAPAAGFFEALDDPAGLDGIIFHHEAVDPRTRRYVPASIKDNALLVLRAAGRVPITSYLRPDSSGRDSERVGLAASLAAAASGLFRNGTTDVKIEMSGFIASQALSLLREVSLETMRRPGQSLTAQFNIRDADLVDDRPTTLAHDGDSKAVADPAQRAELAIALAGDGGFDRVALEGSEILRLLGGTAGLRRVVHQAHSRGLETFIAGGMDVGNVPAAVRSGVGAVGVISAARSNGALNRARIQELIRARNDAEGSLAAEASAVLAALDMAFAGHVLTAPGHRLRRELFDRLQSLDGELPRGSAPLRRLTGDARRLLGSGRAARHRGV